MARVAMAWGVVMSCAILNEKRRVGFFMKESGEAASKPPHRTGVQIIS